MRQVPDPEEKLVLTRFDRLLARMAERNTAYGEEEVAADVEAARSQSSEAET